MKRAALASMLAVAGIAQAAERGWFDGAGAPPSAPSAAHLRQRRYAPKSEAPTPDLIAASARWSNAVQGAKIPRLPEDATVRVAVVGDCEPGRFFWERVFSPGKDAYAKQVAAIHVLAPNAIVQLGDFVSHGTVEQYRAQVAYLDNHVKLPYLSAVGNHDRSSPNGNADKLLYKAVFGEGDYFVDAGPWRLILLDSADRRLTDAQLDWLERALRGGRKAVVFMHVPPAFLKGRLVSPQVEKELEAEEAYRPFQAYFAEGSARFGALASRYGVARVYVGHIHAFGTAVFGGVPYVLTGGGGSPLYPLPPGYPKRKFAHFVDVELGPSGVLRETVRPLEGSPFELRF